MKKITLIYLSLLMVGNLASADERGDQIATKSFALPRNKTESSLAEMQLYNSKNQLRIQQIKLFSQDTSEGRNTFAEFLSPADVKGTKFLTLGHINGDDEQRLFLPALGKVRRISASAKDASFMGTDFNFYDLEDHNFEDFTFTFLREETREGLSCQVVEAVPKDPEAPYSKIIMLFGTSDSFIYWQECYEKSGSKGLVKTIFADEVESLGGVLVAKRITAENLKNSQKTIMVRKELLVNIDLPSDTFSLRKLQ